MGRVGSTHAKTRMKSTVHDNFPPMFWLRLSLSKPPSTGEHPRIFVVVGNQPETATRSCGFSPKAPPRSVQISRNHDTLPLGFCFSQQPLQISTANIAKKLPDLPLTVTKAHAAKDLDMLPLPRVATHRYHHLTPRGLKLIDRPLPLDFWPPVASEVKL